MIETGRFLNISSVNVKKETCEWLADQQKVSGAGLAVYPKREYGFYIAAWDVEDAGDIPADLAKVLDFADLLECDLVCIDRDAPAVDHLPVYDW